MTARRVLISGTREGRREGADGKMMNAIADGQLYRIIENSWPTAGMMPFGALPDDHVAAYPLHQGCGEMRRYIVAAALVLGIGSPASAANPEVLRPRVAVEQREAARAVHNPLSATPENIDKGRVIFHGKGFCAACHGRDGRGVGDDLDLKGPLPRNFTDVEWQDARADGELMWILTHGSEGTAMKPFIPLVLTEEEAWQVLLYVRAFRGR